MNSLVYNGVNKPPLRVRQFLMGGTTPDSYGGASAVLGSPQVEHLALETLLQNWLPKTGLPHHSKLMKRLRCIPNHPQNQIHSQKVRYGFAITYLLKLNIATPTLSDLYRAKSR
ncbi:hypothetical protein HW132_04030 [Brasilonema sp. CT11]|nr:hypothetical protein [Brasilonema sp. CT11]